MKQWQTNESLILYTKRIRTGNKRRSEKKRKKCKNSIWKMKRTSNRCQRVLCPLPEPWVLCRYVIYFANGSKMCTSVRRRRSGRFRCCRFVFSHTQAMLSIIHFIFWWIHCGGSQLSSRRHRRCPLHSRWTRGFCRVCVSMFHHMRQRHLVH